MESSGNSTLPVMHNEKYAQALILRNKSQLVDLAALYQ
jgi:hypothetical protein